MHVTIKQATLEDLDDVAVLFDEYRIFYKQPSDIDGARQYLFDRLAHRESIIFLVRDGESCDPIGFTQLYLTFSSVSMQRSLILNDLYVREDYRNHGIGKRLLDEARSYAVYTKSKGLELSTSISNQTAQRLYESNGYVKDEEFYHYYLSL